jgi:hypothetical protein
MQEYGLRRLSCGVFILTFQVIRGIINATYYRGDIMCDVKKYEKIYEDIQKLQPEDTLQLVLEAETEEQRSFYKMVGDFLLRTLVLGSFLLYKIWSGYDKISVV